MGSYISSAQGIGYESSRPTEQWRNTKRTNYHVNIDSSTLGSKTTSLFHTPERRCYQWHLWRRISRPLRRRCKAIQQGALWLSRSPAGGGVGIPALAHANVGNFPPGNFAPDICSPKLHIFTSPKSLSVLSPSSWHALLEHSRVHNRTPVFSRACLLRCAGRTDVSSRKYERVK